MSHVRWNMVLEWGKWKLVRTPFGTVGSTSPGHAIELARQRHKDQLDYLDALDRVRAGEEFATVGNVTVTRRDWRKLCEEAGGGE